ncbi:unnamed protein product [Paramecium sonneborni]|uniref:Transmembrane protein n=1 Tax=Paramecium sonneborni TaxID=65129 RepID=A0A8S1RQB4_9CILI|nr:unnamed protein product [Paramecium sonneborni]
MQLFFIVKQHVLLSFTLFLCYPLYKTKIQIIEQEICNRMGQMSNVSLKSEAKNDQKLRLNIRLKDFQPLDSLEQNKKQIVIMKGLIQQEIALLYLIMLEKLIGHQNLFLQTLSFIPYCIVQYYNSYS